MSKKVFVSGCYDMLHSGHVAFFEQASKYGDLYVGLGSDKTIFELKGRKTINSEQERLYIVKSIKYVKDAWINSGSGIMDFKEEVLKLKPDIFFVNEDGYTTEKEQFCKINNIQLIVSKRIPSEGLPVRSTTALRQQCVWPYRIQLCGGWLDQLSVNSLTSGSVIVMSIEPTIQFNDRSGMATSSRKQAIKLWGNTIPQGDREQLAKILFCTQNPPGIKYVSGSQDQLGIMLPGINKLNYDNNYWPISMQSIRNKDILNFVAQNMYLLQLSPRDSSYNVLQNTNININNAKKLAEVTEKCWLYIKNKDIYNLGKAMTECFYTQIEMFPNMFNKEIQKIIKKYNNKVCGYKLTGAGGGGYMIMISQTPIPNTIKIKPYYIE